MNAVRPIIPAAGQEQHPGRARQRRAIGLEQGLTVAGRHGAVVEGERELADLAMLAIPDGGVAAAKPVRQMRRLGGEEFRRRQLQALRRELSDMPDPDRTIDRGARQRRRICATTVPGTPEMPCA